MLTSSDKLKVLADIQRLTSRHKRAASDERVIEPITEVLFVRRFGAKVANVRFSRRSDFVGLLVLGKHSGFCVTADSNNVRVLNKCTVSLDGVKVTSTSIVLRSDDSVTNLQPGLLKWVQ